MRLRWQHRQRPAGQLGPDRTDSATMVLMFGKVSVGRVLGGRWHVRWHKESFPCSAWQAQQLQSAWVAGDHVTVRAILTAVEYAKHDGLGRIG